MKYLVNVIATTLCLIFLGAVFTQAKAQDSPIPEDVQEHIAYRLIAFGTCQAIFEKTDGEFASELTNIDKQLQALAWDSGFGTDGNYTADHEVVVETTKAIYQKAVGDIKTAVIAGWDDLPTDMISKAELGCRTEFRDLSKQ